MTMAQKRKSGATFGIKPDVAAAQQNWLLFLALHQKQTLAEVHWKQCEQCRAFKRSEPLAVSPR
ncbi:hypothetical protein ABT56_04255 [Photobacterium aquae]|uniref:Uncharacterized protein n=1 Tax=Photobacterium aquae TaxID=1195763 RepID=A0A0J1H7W4_9GAMM|nr:hypothetical protein ABT56_04255 [Photobacterium aquae]